MAQQRALKARRRMVSRQLQRFRSKARFRFVRSLCREADQRFHFHDVGRFYETLNKIGVHLTERSLEGKMDHGLAEMRWRYLLV